MQGIDPRPPHVRAEAANHQRLRKQLVLNDQRQALELGLEFVGKLYDPGCQNMASDGYAVKSISGKCRILIRLGRRNVLHSRRIGAEQPDSPCRRAPDATAWTPPRIRSISYLRGERCVY